MESDHPRPGVQVHRAPSSAVRLIVSQLLREQLGFREEVVLTPELSLVTLARRISTSGSARAAGFLPRSSAAAPPRTTTTSRTCGRRTSRQTHSTVPGSAARKLGRVRARSGAPLHPGLPPARRLLRRPRGREVDVVSLHVFGYGETTLDRLQQRPWTASWAWPARYPVRHVNAVRAVAPGSAQWLSRSFASSRAAHRDSKLSARIEKAGLRCCELTAGGSLGHAGRPGRGPVRRGPALRAGERSP